ncbi:MAG: hypothetical protein ABIP21_00240 [Acidimicrobiia bacterium]
MADTTPLTRTLQANVAAVAAGADLETKLGEAPFAGTVTRVAYVPASTITGANTDSRTLQLFNRGAAGSGTTKVAELALTSGVNATADDDKAVTVITASSADVVAAGDVLEYKSLHIGSTGLADGGGLVIVEITRS